MRRRGRSSPASRAAARAPNRPWPPDPESTAMIRSRPFLIWATRSWSDGRKSSVPFRHGCFA